MKNLLLLFFIFVVSFFISSCCYNDEINYSKLSKLSEKPTVIVTDYIKNDGKTDVADAIQALIENNPNRTIYFPDGTYLLSHSIKTPADPKRSVFLKLDNYAVLKASDNWTEKDAVVRLGGIYPKNDISTNGSYYGISGGIIDGNGKANGISVDSGRETIIRDISIKNVKIGIHIKIGANYGSSDTDIFGVNLVGTNELDSIGILTEGHDNTITNIRAASFVIGVKLNSGGNSLRNVHPLYIYPAKNKLEHHSKSCGFVDLVGGNWHNFSYCDQFATAFVLGENPSILNHCQTFYYSKNVKYQTVIKNIGKFNSIITDFRATLSSGDFKKTILDAKKGGKGVFQNLIINCKLPKSDLVKEHLKGNLIN